MTPRETVIVEKHEEDCSEQWGVSRYNTPMLREWTKEVSEKVLFNFSIFDKKQKPTN